jgi:RNA polymerase sigma-70 factor (ECF subfamily)
VTAADDRLLVDRCVRNEPGAWRLFVDRFAPTVRSLARKYVALHGHSPDESELDDHVQEVFVALTRKDFHLLRGYDPRYSFKTYLGVITRTQVYRSHRRRRPLSADEEGLEAAAPTVAPPGEAVEKEEEIDALTRALDDLEPRDAEILRMRFLREMDYLGISRALEIPEASVGQTLFRAKQRLLGRLKRFLGLIVV